MGLPMMIAMRKRYPDVRLRLVESLSGHLAQLLNARQLDLACCSMPTRRGAGVASLCSTNDCT